MIRNALHWAVFTGLAAALAAPSSVGDTNFDDADTARRPGSMPLLEGDLRLARRAQTLPLLGGDVHVARRETTLPLLGGDLRTARRAQTMPLLGGDRIEAASGHSIPLLGGDYRSSDVQFQAAMADISAALANQTATGDGVKVAVLDGGFDLDHEFLDGALIAEYDAYDDDNDAQDLGNDTDDDLDGLTDESVGHGTAVAGLVLAVAPDAQIIPVRVMNDDGVGSDDGLRRGIDHAVAEGADVIVISLVVPSLSQALMDAIDDAVADDIAIVTAAGNDPNGPSDATYLADRAAVVGGVDDNAALLSWSPTGTDVDLYGPALDVIVPLGGDVADSYATWSGTSFAAAFVAGAAALVKEDTPLISNADMIDQLADNVTSITGATPSTAGRIDCDAAVE